MSPRTKSRPRWFRNRPAPSVTGSVAAAVALSVTLAIGLSSLLVLTEPARAQPNDDLVLVRAQLLVVEKGLVDAAAFRWTRMQEVLPDLRVARLSSAEFPAAVTETRLPDAILAGQATTVAAPKIVIPSGERGEVLTGISRLEVALGLEVSTRRAGDQLLLDLTTHVERLGEERDSMKVLSDHLVGATDVLLLVEPFASSHPAFSERQSFEWLLLLSATAFSSDLDEEQRAERIEAPFGLIYEPTYSGEPVSVSLRDADLRDVLDTFSRLTGAEIELGPEVGPVPVTVELQDVPWDQALGQIVKMNCLVTEIGEPGKIRIRRALLPCRGSTLLVNSLEG